MRLALGLGLMVAVVSALGCEKSGASPDKPKAASVPVTSGAPIAAAGSAGAREVHVETVSVPEVSIDPTRESKVKVSWKTPAGTGVNSDAPFKVRWTTSEGLEAAPPDAKGKGGDVMSGFDVPVKPMSGVPGGTLAGTVELVVCDVETHAVCVPVKRKIEMSFRTAKGAPTEVPVSVPLPEARPRG
ncbi:MAG: hypothetical protein JNL38_13590 [Myxococcales bacterium]|nr:hypothetical protein [Myxococcales bacterium]